MPRDWKRMSTFSYDPKDRPADFFNFDDLFAQGIIVSGEVSVNTKFLGMPGEQHVTAMWKHVDWTVCIPRNRSSAGGSSAAPRSATAIQYLYSTS